MPDSRRRTAEQTRPSISLIVRVGERNLAAFERFVHLDDTVIYGRYCQAGLQRAGPGGFPLALSE